MVSSENERERVTDSYAQIGAMLCIQEKSTYLQPIIKEMLEGVGEGNNQALEHICSVLRGYSEATACKLVGVSHREFRRGNCPSDLSQRIAAFANGYTEALKTLFGIPPSPNAQSPTKNNPSSTP